MKISQHDAAMDDFDIQRERGVFRRGSYCSDLLTVISHSRHLGVVWPAG
ncbi:Putative HlyD family secretion protein [Salmonella enterica subsp. enterica]|nr:Putative HlyD family secretion protein [Salmonella enterica subsp. enterica]